MKLEFTVIGEPAPAGSKRAFVIPGTNRASVTDANPKSRVWKQIVSQRAHDIYGDAPLLDGPLSVVFRFFEPRPKGHFKKDGSLSADGQRANFPAKRPDVLKLSRGVEDALSKVVWRDDAQIVTELLEKRWGEPARVEITIETL